MVPVSVVSCIYLLFHLEWRGFCHICYGYVMSRVTDDDDDDDDVL
jgi:hypothetical protein